MDDPVLMKRFNGWAAIFFAILIIPSMIFGWLEVVAFVSVLSIWALVAAHWSNWQAARVEEKADLANTTRRRRISVTSANRFRYRNTRK